MKKCLLALALLLAVWMPSYAQVVIDEIMYNPPESGTDSLEYIEILNTGNAAVNLEGWSFEGIEYVFPAGSSLPAGGFRVLSKTAVGMQAIFGVATTQWTSGALSNGGETLRLKDAAGTVIDEVAFTAMAPWPVAAGNGRSIVLCNPTADNSLPESWSLATTLTNAVINNTQVFANPGAASGCVTGLVAQPDLFTVVPAQPSTLNVLANDNVPGTVSGVTVTVAPLHGTATVVNNNVLYTPTAGYCGPDVLTYQVCNGPQSCATAVANITVKCYPVRTIQSVTTENAQGLADSSNVSCELTGTLYGPNIRPTGLQFVIINPTGEHGITVFRNTGNFGYTVQEGDNITVRGTIAQFNGLTQIIADTLVKVSSNNPLVNASVVTKLGEDTENRLIRFNNMRYVDPTQWTPGVGSGFNVRIYSPDNINDTITMRIDNDIDLFMQTTPPVEPFDVIGLGAQFDSSTPLTGGYQFLPRYAADIFPTVSTFEAGLANQVRLQPNPVQDVLTVVTTTAFDRIQVYAMTGQLLKSIAQPQQNEQIDMQQLAAGVYYIRFEQAASFWTTRVIKQ